MYQWNRLDDHDREIIAKRGAALLANGDPINPGDFITFACGTTRRVSYVWIDGDEGVKAVQTSDGGSWYLGDGYVSFSGALYTGVPFETLTDTGDTFDGDVWIFHHDHHCADNGVHSTTKFRVWRCSMEAPKC